MKVENTNLANQIKDVYVSDSGIFYFLDGIIISEINEGVTYTWDEAQEIINEALKHYPSGKQICYISNRVNKYSVKPQDWLKFQKANLKLNGYAIVTEFESSWQSALMEKFFFRFKMERFNDLHAAISWCRSRNQNVYRQFNVG